MSNVLGRRVLGHLLSLLLFETVLIVSAVALAAWLRLGPEAQLLLFVEGGLQKAFLIAFACQICLYYADLYNPRVIADRRELFVRTVRALGVTSFVLAALYYWIPALIIGRGVVLIAAALVIATVIGWRLAFEWIVLRVAPRERLLIVGTSPGAVALARELHAMRGQIGVELVGFVDVDPGGRPRRRQSVGCTGQPADGQAPRDEDRGRVVRAPCVSLRGVHGQDRRRKPAAKLVHLL
jgi:FlaA1/EpsC-like NDP-sugar epimerase